MIPNQSTDFEKALGKITHLPLLNQLKNIKASQGINNNVIFGKFDWIVVQNDDLVYFYKQCKPNLHYSSQLALSDLFRCDQSKFIKYNSKSENQFYIYFLERSYDNKRRNQFLLFGANQCVIYEIDEGDQSFQMSLMNRISFHFRYLSTLEDENNFYIISSYMELLIISKTKKQIITLLQSKLRSSVLHLLQTYSPQETDITAVEFNKHDNDSLLVVAYHEKGNYILITLQRMDFQDSQLKQVSYHKINCDLFILSSFKIFADNLYMVFYQQSQQQRQIVVFSYQLIIKDNKIQQSSAVDEYQVIDKLHQQKFEVYSQLFQMNNNRYLLYQYDGINKYIKLGSEDILKQFNGLIQGVGIVQKQDKQILKIAFEKQLYDLDIQEINYDDKLIQRNFDISYNADLYKELLIQFHRFTKWTKGEFYADVSLEIAMQQFERKYIEQVINGITREILDQPLNQTIDEQSQYQQKYVTLTQWKQFIKLCYYNLEVLVNINECIHKCQLVTYLIQNKIYHNYITNYIQNIGVQVQNPNIFQIMFSNMFDIEQLFIEQNQLSDQDYLRLYLKILELFKQLEEPKNAIYWFQQNEFILQLQQLAKHNIKDGMNSQIYQLFNLLLQSFKKRVRYNSNDEVYDSLSDLANIYLNHNFENTITIIQNTQSYFIFYDHYQKKPDSKLLAYMFDSFKKDSQNVELFFSYCIQGKKSEQQRITVIQELLNQLAEQPSKQFQILIVEMQRLFYKSFKTQPKLFEHYCLKIKQYQDLKDFIQSEEPLYVNKASSEQGRILATFVKKLTEANLQNIRL